MEPIMSSGTVDVVMFALSVLALIGHLSQRERQVPADPAVGNGLLKCLGKRLGQLVVLFVKLYNFEHGNCRILQIFEFRHKGDLF